MNKFIEKRNEEEVMLDDVKKILQKKGYKVQAWSSYEANINNEKVYIRPGSKKSKGWQITFRDLFKNALQTSNGFLLMPRDGIILIPFSIILTVIDDKKTAFKNNTIDMFIEFTEENKVNLNYKKNSIDISDYRIIK
ncbi:MAG: hypothetical protein HY738_03095 [Bacteroidia bacterium]|nr:hypothetical protein [Bacteroidia bacterium]